LHPVAVVDGGDLFWKGGALDERRLPQQQEKARLMVEAMSLTGLDAWVPGEADWEVGAEFLLQLVDAHETPLLAGNLVCGERQFPGHRLVKRGGMRIGFIGVVDYTVVGCSVSDPALAALEAAEALGEVDLLMGIFHGEATLDSKVLDALPDLDFFFNGHTGQSQSNPREVKGAWFLGTGKRGKRIGRLALEWSGDEGAWVSAGAQAALETRLDRYRTRVRTSRLDLEDAKSDAEKKKLQRRIDHHQKQAEKVELEIAELGEEASDNRFRHSLVDLDRKIEDHSPTAVLVAAAKDKIEAAALKGAQATRKSQLPFVGSETCRGCHPAQYAQWKSTPHASAWASLVADNRSMDADCFACHVTGAHHPKGPTFPTEVGPLLVNVGCEACHGPGEAHLAKPVASMHAGAVLETCTDCHDGIRDEGRFDAEIYLPKVTH
jgi:2',3'-cyclic-nucleotide 2'-phosphodiesterase (5'-nucleotidase family)